MAVLFVISAGYSDGKSDGVKPGGLYLVAVFFMAPREFVFVFVEVGLVQNRLIFSMIEVVARRSRLVL